MARFGWRPFFVVIGSGPPLLAGAVAAVDRRLPYRNRGILYPRRGDLLLSKALAMVFKRPQTLH